MAFNNFKYFQIQSKENTYYITCNFSEDNEYVDSEASSIFALLFYQTKGNIRVDLKNVRYLSMNFVSRLLNLAGDLRRKNRMLQIQNAIPPFKHYLMRFGLEHLVFLAKEQTLNQPPNLP